MTQTRKSYSWGNFRLLQQLLSFAIIAVSVLLAVFLVIETPKALPPAPVEHYRRVLVNIYLSTREWKLVHYIESAIEKSELDSDQQNLYMSQLWDNFRSAPEEYLFARDGPRDPLGGVFYNRASDFYVILRNRSQYLAEDTTPFLELFESLNRFDRSESSGILMIEGLFSEQIPWIPLPYDLYRYPTPPRYSLIVYESLRRAPSSPSLLEISQDILRDRGEDPLLRVAAAYYLSEHSDSAEPLLELVEESLDSGYFLEGPLHGTPGDTAFQLALLEILNAEVSDLELKSTDKAEKGEQ